MPSADQEIDSIERSMDLPRLVAYGGATWDWHRIHYDAAYVASQNLPAPVVDGQMLGALLAEQVMDHFGPGARIRSMALRYRSMVFAGDTVRVTGKIQRVADEASGLLVTVAQEVRVGDRLAVTGTSAVWTPQ